MKIFVFALKCWLLSVLTNIIMYQIYFSIPPIKFDNIEEGIAFLFGSLTSLITIFVASFITSKLIETVKKFKVTLSTICFVVWLSAVAYTSPSISSFLVDLWFPNLLHHQMNLLIIAPIVGLLIGIWIFKVELKNSDVAMEHKDILDADI